MNSVVLPWPRAALSPNARGHWSRRAKAARADKGDAHTLFLAAGARSINAERLDVSLTFRPPDARRRDMDNTLARCKALLDGAALALGVDDSRWRLSLEMGPPVKGGAVIIKWEAAQ